MTVAFLFAKTALSWSGVEEDGMKKIGMFAALLLLASCAHHRDVRPSADGIHRVVTRGPDKDEVERDAISQANHYCSERNKQSAAFVSEGTQYTGSMSESAHKTTRNASKAATVVGSGMGVFGGQNEANAGAVVGGAGVVGNIMTGGDAYTTEMRFKCQ